MLYKVRECAVGIAGKIIPTDRTIYINSNQISLLVELDYGYYRVEYIDGSHYIVGDELPYKIIDMEGGMY